MKRIILLLWICLPFVMKAQVDLRISVSDANTGKGLPDIPVRLINDELGIDWEANTNLNGLVLFRALPVAGEYRAIIEENDTYYEGIAGSIVLRANQPASASIALLEKASFELDEVIIGANTATQINAVNAEVSSSFKKKEIEILPTEGRDITRLLFRLPNVTQATGFYPEAPNVAINGANALYTNYMIDGMDNNERFLGGQKFSMPVGFTQDVTVLTNNFSVEFGNTANGVINLTSRSGSNTTSGEVFFVTRPGPAIDGTIVAEGDTFDLPQRDLTGNQVQNGFQRYQGGFSLGGALVKDKTFYYINAEQTIDIKDNLLRVPELGINETVRGTNSFTLLSAKIDQVWTPNLRTSLRVNGGLVNVDRQGGGLTGGVTFPSAGNSQDRNSLLIAAKTTYAGANSTSETNYQFSRFRWNYSRPNNPDDPQVTVNSQVSGNTIAVLGHPGFVFDSRENTHQIQQKFTFYQGNHTFKAGIELISSGHSLFGGGNPNGSYTLSLNGAQIESLRNQGVDSGLGVEDLSAFNPVVTDYSVELRPNSYGVRQNIFSLYAEDQWSISSRLNVNIGLRYDYDNLSRGAADQGDLNNIAPRVSFNYQLPNRASIRGGAGIFYDKIIYAIYSDALQQNTTSDDYRRQIQELIDLGRLPQDTDIDEAVFEGNLSAGFSIADSIDYLNGPTAASLQERREGVFSGDRRILSPFGYDNPVTQQYTLGFQKQFGKNILFYVDLMHNRSSNLFRIRNLNPAAPYPINDPNNVVPRSQADADASRFIPIANNAAVIDGDTLTGVSRNVIITESGGESRYYAASFNFQKDRGEDKYDFRLIYTLSRLENDTEDINFRAMDGNNFDKEWGPSINDRTHVVNGIFNFYPYKGFALSMATLFQSGQPINYIPNLEEVDFASFDITPTTDLNGDGRSFGDAYVGNSDRYPGESRNSGRLPWAYTVDLGLQYLFELGLDRRLRVRADIFNLFNTANFTGYSNNATQSNQIQTGPPSDDFTIRNVAPPRQFQFSLNYYF